MFSFCPTPESPWKTSEQRVGGDIRIYPSQYSEIAGKYFFFNNLATYESETFILKWYCSRPPALDVTYPKET